MWGYELQALGIPFHATILFTYLRIFLSFIEVLLHNIKLNSLVYDTWISMFPLLGGSWDMLYLDERLCGTIIILTKVMWGYELQALGIPFHATILFTYLRIFLSFIEKLICSVQRIRSISLGGGGFNARMGMLFYCCLFKEIDERGFHIYFRLYLSLLFYFLV
ncbi:uncharacterized protein LOC122076931 isoform X3 [Macadamia integrifolia]|nr:uncharacterized protein LOC122076931 isoform X3 [Macadamia integrifolia]XP_042498530.1 uncharacterized protein LOC122076931 isoform X3 [Macadamia integrifolia]